ncbi:zinc finger protein 615 isoform X1 [Bactrocera neohumeralis]|uniref:zinc finger protein 615 isoform X1 n=1 Tax=Bactrocera neohumeralis TaxID=98809 RepID=UPI0021654DC4|nr:zinc finger protein 615 isoform X1 [Bactrocera neohumeralis]
MAVVVDLKFACIICLQDDGGELISVFSGDKESTTQSEPESSLSIAEKISLCSVLNLSNISIKVSNKICNRCLDDLSVAWRFWKNCETTNSLFRSIQQEENGDVSLVNCEVDCDKMKLPTSLKTQPAHSDIKSYIDTPEVDGEQSDDIDPNEAEKSEDDLDSISGFGIVEYIDEDEQKQSDESTDYFNCIREESLESNEDFKVIQKQSNIEKVSNLETQNEINTTEYGLKFEAEIKEEFSEDGVEDDSIGFISKQTEDDFSNSENNIISSYNKSKTNAEKKLPFKKKLSYKKLSTPTEAKYNYPQKLSHKSKTFHASIKICEICGNIYKYQHALNAHMRRHNNDRQFGCELCDKAFVSNVELKRHMRVHTGQKPYPCSFCERRFSDFGSRSKHERTHTGERPYRCTTCNKSFAYPHVLTVHLRTHTGEKKFQCTRCGRGFTKKVYLLAHIENHTRCENMSLITRMNDNESVVSMKSDSDTTQQQGIIAIKTVALEECIFTTELVSDSGNLTNGDDDISRCTMELEDAIDEEHLEDDNNVEYILGNTQQLKCVTN